VRVKVVPDYFDPADTRTSQESLGDIPLSGLGDSAISGFPRLVKRIFDLVVATIGTICISPLLLSVALAIRLDSPGPAFFKQQRVGENGVLFWMYKFRSMIQDAERRQNEGEQTTSQTQIFQKSRDDPRVTRVGHWLRRTSLDELPQLFNVIKGEMSLVGPRPELTFLVELYEPWQRKRFAVPQGITGWWQVNGRSDRLMHLKTQDDLYYIQNYSLLLDLQILWMTIGVVFKGRGAF
jgi:exopolysaccharide biosynthesis polyprenyl glycosylphosphotransferase